MSSSHVLQDQSLLSRCDQWLDALERRLTLLAGAVVLLMVLFSVINIIGRGVFSKPFNAYFDLMGQSVPLIAFLGISYCQRHGGHIRMDLLLIKLKGRWLWVFEFLNSLLALFVITTLTYGAYLHAGRSFTLGDSTEDIGLTIWPFKAAIAFMFAVLIARLLIQAWAYLRIIIVNDERPIAIPVPENVETQALRESEQVQTSDEGQN